MGSVYNHLFMGKKKGDLGHVWLAAHFPNRIRKSLVENTNITSSVDKILVDQLPVVTYRILGFLLLGVARIYSKKVEYLLVDCNKSMNENKCHSEGRKKVDVKAVNMCSPESSSRRSITNVADIPESSSRHRRNTFVDAMRAQFSSISLPENFELDSFELEVVEEEGSDSHVKSHLEIALPDAWENDRIGHHTFGKDPWGASSSFSDHASGYATTSNINSSNAETSAENLRDRFSLDECMDPMILSESDEEVDLTIIPSIVQDLQWNTTDDNMIFEDRERNIDKQPVEECTTGETVVSEMPLTDNIMVKPSPEKSQLSVTIDATPQSKAPGVSGEHKPDFVAVRTPASREPLRATRKRKSVYDDILVVPNSVFKEWVADSSELVGKRKRALTPLLAMKKRRSSDYFRESIIPINADFPSGISTNDVVLLEEVENTTEPNIKMDELESLDLPKTLEETEPESLAPSTPVTQSTSFRFSETHETSKAKEVGPTSSFESQERHHVPIKDIAELEEIQMEEGPSSLGEENQETVLVAEKWSAVTKNVGSYLHSNFEHKKKKGVEETVNLSQILKHKTKKESAKFFSQILVLKTGGYINVKQEKAYDEICVTATSKLKQVFEGGNRG